MCIGDDLNSYRLDDTWLALQGALGPFNRLQNARPLSARLRN
jgi:hypothetical protein